MTLDHIFRAREGRGQVHRVCLELAQQVAYTCEYNVTAWSVVSLTVVAPGPEKDHAKYRTVFAAGARAVDAVIERTLNSSLVVARELLTATGPLKVWAVPLSPEQVKAETVRLEEHSPVGRLWDIDVLTEYLQPISRTHLGHAPRRCLVCTDAAVVCTRAQRHSLPEVLAQVDALCQEVARA